MLRKTIQVPTNMNKPADQVFDLSSLSETDLKSLESSNPFLYNSITEVYKAKLKIEKVDHSELVSPKTSPSRTSRKQGMSSAPKVVRRKSRLSTESHPSLIFDDDELDASIDTLLSDDFELSCDLFDVLGGSLSTLSK